MSKELINLDTKREQMTNQKKFPEDFEREALKDSVYLLEEQQAIMKNIMEEEARKPAKIYIVNLPETAPKKDDTANVLPF